MRPFASLAVSVLALALAACGGGGVDVPEAEEEEHAGAVLFSERCAGCHTISAAGAQGSGQNNQRVQGPSFDDKAVDFEDALFAIRNGGFSGAVMPQNIVTGADAEAVARFLAEYSGADAERPPDPREAGGGDGGP